MDCSLRSIPEALPPASIPMKLSTLPHWLPRFLASLALPLALHAAAPTFDPFATVKCADRADHMVMGDFDGDGVPDVAVLNNQGAFNTGMFTGHATVFFGNGTGGFNATTASIQITSSSQNFDGMAAGPVLGHTVSGHKVSDLLFALGGSVQVWEYNGSAFVN